MTKKLFFYSLLSILVTSPLLGEANIQRHFPQLRDFRFVMESEITDAASQPLVGGIPREFLIDAALNSYSVWTVTSANGSGGSLRLEVFEASDPSGAYMLYTLWPESLGKLQTSTSDLGFSNQLYPGGGIFWKGNFLFHLAATAGGPLSPQRFNAFASQVGSVLAIDNMLPVSATHLPGEELVPGSIRFYLGAASLSTNKRFPEPLLEEIGFSDRIEIAFASYGPGKEALFLIGYPTPQLADEYFLKLQNRLQGFFSAEGIYMKRTGVLVCLLVGPEARALEVLPRVKYSPSIKWLYEKEDSISEETMTFFGLLTKTILGIGIFLVLLIGSGFVVGFLRYEFIRRFPNVFRRKEMISLGLGQREGTETSQKHGE